MKSFQVSDKTCRSMQLTVVAKKSNPQMTQRKLDILVVCTGVILSFILTSLQKYKKKTKRRAFISKKFGRYAEND